MSNSGVSFEKTRVVVKNIPERASEQQIREHFKELGAITDMKLLRDDSGASRRICFIGFSGQESAAKAVELYSRSYLMNCRLFVDYARTKAEETGPVIDENSKDMELIRDTGRLYVTNIPYECTVQEIESHFSRYGRIVDVNFPQSDGKFKGYGFVTYMYPEEATIAFSALKSSLFKGRILSVTGAREAPEKKRAAVFSDYSTVFFNFATVLKSYNSRNSLRRAPTATDIALHETELIEKTKTFLSRHGIVTDGGVKSQTMLVYKSMPFGTTENELMDLFKSYPNVSIFIAPSRVVAVLVFSTSAEASAALREKRRAVYKGQPIYLDYANVTGETVQATSNMLYVKNLSYKTKEETLFKYFLQFGAKTASIVTKKEGDRLQSLGYGFVSFSTEKEAALVLKTRHTLDNHVLMLSYSSFKEKKERASTVNSSKLVVKNLAFEATKAEIAKLFSAHATVRTVTLPLKKDGTHRGFAFVEFANTEEARKAHEALKYTHVYGRHLVMEESNDPQREELKLYS